MSKHKIIGLALCGLMLTSCGNGGENTAEGTVSPETSAASESVSETTVSETEAETETEIPESSETVTEETKSTENFDKVKDMVIFEDGENTLTVGQYIDALLQCNDFTEQYINGIQLADIDGDGIPEALARISSFPVTVYFSVSAEGKATMLYDANGYNRIYAELPEPYELEDKTVWLAKFYINGNVGGGGGNCVLTYEHDKIKNEIIRCYNYSTDGFECDCTYYWGSDGEWDGNDAKGEEITEEEYKSRYEAFLAEMQPSEARYSVNRVYYGATYDYYELPELLTDMLKEYLEK